MMNHKILISIITLTFGIRMAAYSEPLAIYFARSCSEDYSIKFTAEDFLNNYDGDRPLVSVTFPQLPPPDEGRLLLGSTPVKSYDVIPLSELGNISFLPTDGFSGEVFVYWNAYDGTLYSPDAAIQIAVSERPDKSSALTEPAGAPATEEISFPYADMESHWANVYAAKTADMNIMRGEQIGGKYYFNPEKLLTRGDFVMMLNAALDISNAVPDEGFSFTDSAALPEWLDRQGRIAYQAGILQGVSDGSGVAFHPDDELTRIETIKMVDNVMSGIAVPDSTDLTFKDTSSVPLWGKDALRRTLSTGIISGYTDNTIRPYASINKATASKIICSMLSEAPFSTVQKNIMSRLTE